MGKAMVWVWAAAMAASLAAGPALADEGKGGRDADGGKDRFPMIERMAKKLELSPAQVDQLKKLELAHREAMKPLWKQAKEQMAALHGLVEKKAPDADLTAAVSNLKATRKAIQAENDKHMDAAGAVLTPMQQAKTALWMGRMAGKRMKGMRGGWQEREGHHGDDAEEGRHGDGDEDD